MALNDSALISDLTTLFKEGSTDVTSAAQAWADAFEKYASAITPPTTAFTAGTATVNLASALETTFSVFSSSTPDFAVLLASDIAAWAVEIGAGMAPSFTAVPPVSAALITPLTTAFTANFQEGVTNESAASTIGAVFTPWMITGTATNVSSGSTVNWA